MPEKGCSISEVGWPKARIGDKGSECFEQVCVGSRFTQVFGKDSCISVRLGKVGMSVAS